ncbi:hypothetical protein BO70DRAFT_401597 [Aspergillus heteromorphus CBS 117.55]|uniref:Uncharacterized protein n=1 Tax=Aspergillus heteromorphus CBS 117.55 TaxID=1448321 RepID=A0A317URN3_9EURO|nr:uncharacterized protein BO70DRAFT_401597 [Aspergillus heteromorphus CBS 117.55]PWY62700.1 hypothetical protein BO70DRAFT_401597 [Aspergillus heteromorphus CBS 117.55]
MPTCSSSLPSPGLLLPPRAPALSLPPPRRYTPEGRSSRGTSHLSCFRLTGESTSSVCAVAGAAGWRSPGRSRRATGRLRAPAVSASPPPPLPRGRPATFGPSTRVQTFHGQKVNLGGVVYYG